MAGGLSDISFYVIMVAGGTGTRMESVIAKQFISVAGKPIIVHSIERFLEAIPEINVVLVLHHSLHAAWEDIRKTYLPQLNEKNFILCEGGAERTDSVHHGLRAMLASGAAEDDAGCLVAVHDAVRPLISYPVILNAFGMAADKGNSVVCVPVKSSMRMKTKTGSQSVDRNLFYHVQTPQIFRFPDLLNWYENRPNQLFTDDASLAEHFGCDIQICEGSYDNIKITTPEDLAVAEILLTKS